MGLNDHENGVRVNFLDQLNAASPAEFVALLDGTYEHSPWIAERAAAARPFRSLEHLKQALAEVVRRAPREEQLALIRAHPELAGKAMVSKSLTAESTNEQGKAGLTDCTPAEFAHIQQLNADYNARFGFPFIMAVKGNRLAICADDKSQGHFVNLESIELNPDSCCKVFLKGLDFPVSITQQVFRNKNQSTGILYLACSNLDLNASDINTIYQKRWKVEEFHKSLKSNLALAKSPTGIPHTQKNHIFACFFAFVKLERLRIKTKLNHFALKSKLYFNAIRASFSLLQKLAIPST